MLYLSHTALIVHYRIQAITARQPQKCLEPVIAASVEEGGAIFATCCFDRALPDTNLRVLAGRVEDVMEVSTQVWITGA
jgi:hypothetical protein